MKSKQSAWSSSKTERVYWERWFVNLQIINQRVNTKSRHTRVDHGGIHVAPYFNFEVFISNPDASWIYSVCCIEFTLEEKKLHRSALEASIRENLLRIIKFANEKMDHLPHISPNVEGISYPYEIAILRFSFLS